MAARAWVLNLDAELELAVPAYTPSDAVRAAVRARVPALAAALLEPGDVLVDEASAPGVARGLPGRAFSPTPRALALLRRAGAEPEAHPSVEVLRRVCSRAFAASLGQTLPGAVFATDLETARATLATAPPTGGAWRVKRAFGMSGRGQRVVTPGALAEADAAFVRAAVQRGGVQIEPDLEVMTEYALHGMLSERGALTLGRLVTQRCDARGAWLATEPVPPGAAPAIDARLRAEATSVASALHTAGYFGPFGIDAYVYQGGDGAPALQPRSEVNARLTMGFAAGFDGAKNDIWARSYR